MNSSVPGQNLPELIQRYTEFQRKNEQFERFNQILHTYHSCAVDGNLLNWEEGFTLLDKGLTDCSKPLTHHLALIDFQFAQHKLLKLAVQHAPINRNQLQQSSAVIMRHSGGIVKSLVDSFDTRKGEFRTIPATTGSRPFLDPKKVPEAVDSLLKTMNTDLSLKRTTRQIYELSFEIHYQFVCIHPFGDGNGRIARLLMNYIQRYHQLPLSLVFTQDKSAYYSALDTARRQGSSRYINEFMFQQLIKFLSQEINRLSKQ